MVDERIQCCLEGGTAVFLATIAPNGMPFCSRAIAIRSDDNLATATVYLPIATSRETLANLATTHRIAVTVAKPIEHVAVQLKGTGRNARFARPDEETFVRTRLDGFADVLDKIGIPRRVTRSFAHWPAFAIEVAVDEIFDQTPGPKAGTRLR